MSSAEPFTLRRIAVPAFGPSLLFGLGEGAILPIVPLSARDLGASVALAALAVALIGIGSLVSNIPASLITMRRGERWAVLRSPRISIVTRARSSGSKMRDRTCALRLECSFAVRASPLLSS